MTEAFPANREAYVEKHGSERSLRLLHHKFLGRCQRAMPLAGLRLRLLRRLGVRIDASSSEKPPWIAGEVYIDDTFPELVTLGAGSVLGVRATLLCHDDARRTVAPITVGRNAYVGAGAIVLPGVHVGDGAVVGAGAVVTRSVPAGETWAGVPARKIRGPISGTETFAPSAGSVG